jgi:hypothetical protein
MQFIFKIRGTPVAGHWCNLTLAKKFYYCSKSVFSLITVNKLKTYTYNTHSIPLLTYANLALISSYIPRIFHSCMLSEVCSILQPVRIFLGLKTK